MILMVSLMTIGTPVYFISCGLISPPRLATVGCLLRIDGERALPGGQGTVLGIALGAMIIRFVSSYNAGRQSDCFHFLRAERQPAAAAIVPNHSIPTAEGSGTADRLPELLPGEMVPPMLFTSPPMVPEPLQTPSSQFSVPPPVERTLLMANSPMPVLVNVLPLRFKTLLNMSVALLLTSTAVSLRKFTDV